MAFAVATPLALEWVVMEYGIQLLALDEATHDHPSDVHVVAALLAALEVLIERLGSGRLQR
jgi:hypothetical protein